MLDTSLVDSDLSTKKNLTWLFLLRTILIAGEVSILLVAVYVVKYKVPEDPLWAIISSLIILNSLTWYRLQTDFPVTELELFIHLVGDVAGITAILYYTGGATNPIAWFFLLPLIITATVLPQIYTWGMLALTSACYTLLILYFIPLPEIEASTTSEHIPRYILEMQTENNLNIHVFATWFGFLLIAGIVAYFVVEMANTLHERNRKLAEVREIALRNERVIALGTLAAGAAHEMGTPLGTMAILVHDMEQEYSGEEFQDFHENMRILKEQVNRCKEALSVLSASAGEIRADSGHMMAVDAYLNELIEQWRQQQPNVLLETDVRGMRPPPGIIAERTLSHALVNILNNAADVSPNLVQIKARWSKVQLTLEIRDHGPGINPSIAKSAGKTPVSTKSQGLGVGLFLAKSTIDRLGGKIEFFNHETGGACTRIKLPMLSTS